MRQTERVQSRLMTYVKSFDGVRAVAIIAVILFHLGLLLPGWIGVQLFFVLSGYLITTLLLEEKHRPLPDFLVRFYMRRSLRIFPLYIAFLLAAAACYWATGLPRSFASDWPFLVSYTTNFGRLAEQDIGAAFVHLWSLAVEEQFYLAWPLLVWALPLRPFKYLILLLIFLSPLSRLVFYVVFQDSPPEWIGRSIYALPSSQVDAFAVGAAIPLWGLERWKNIPLAAGSIFGLTALLGALVLAYQHLAYHSAIKWSFGYSMYLLPGYGFVWAYSVINVASAAFILLALQRHWSCRLLEWAPLVFIGRISYGLYILHVPLLLATMKIGVPHSLQLGLFSVSLFLAASLSFLYFERPLLRMKARFN